jgi:hypothetical protein
MDGTISVSIRGLSKFEGLPAALEQAQRRFVDELAKGIAAEFRKHIRSRGSGGLAEHWKGHGIDSTRGIVEASGPVYLKASVRGAFVKARNGKVLRFEKNGQVFFRRWIRITPGDYIGQPDDRKTSYVTLALRNRRAIGERALADTLGNPLRP